MKITQLILAGSCLLVSSLPVSAKEAYDPDYASDHILTPKPAATPRINGAKVFGARPGAPFLFTVAATGQKPLKYHAKDLPEGLKLDKSNGRITGSVKKAGTYRVMLAVQNSRGVAKRELRIEIGDTICLTPPMGWNSWYFSSELISQKVIIDTAQAMVDSGLAAHGWTYVNIDDCWQGERGGKFNALQGNERFPDIPAMCDKVHELGLKIGIYSTPWMGTYAGFRGGTWKDEKADYLSEALPEDKRLQPTQIYGRYPGTLKRGLDKVGPAWFCDADALQWAEWGIDYVKYDWKPNDIPTTKRLAKDLRASGRDIILSLSNTAPFENAEGLSKLANLWRTTGDIHETWGSISKIGFSQERWQAYTSPGHWNDPDMLQIGMIATPNRQNKTFHRTGLTPDEQYTQFSLWSLLSAPLILSCDLTRLDDFTRSLLTNDEVIEVNQDPMGAPARKVHGGEIWAKELEDGTVAVGLFNRDRSEKTVTVSLAKLGLKDKVRVRDLWRQKNLGSFTGSFSAKVRGHGVVLLRMGGERTEIPALARLPKGLTVVSDDAKVSYSSRSEWAPEQDTLLTGMKQVFAFHTEKERKPWLRIDLGKVQPVAAIEVFNRTDEFASRAKNLHVWVSADGKDWKQVYHWPDPEPRWLVNLKTPKNARFVKIGLINDTPEFFHLKGVKVYTK